MMTLWNLYGTCAGCTTIKLRAGAAQLHCWLTSGTDIDTDINTDIDVDTDIERYTPECQH